jgi:hypothetical protein
MYYHTQISTKFGIIYMNIKNYVIFYSNLHNKIMLDKKYIKKSIKN